MLSWNVFCTNQPLMFYTISAQTLISEGHKEWRQALTSTSLILPLPVVSLICPVFHHSPLL